MTYEVVSAAVEDGGRTPIMKSTGILSMIAAFVTCLCTGCASVLTHTQKEPEGKGPYSGVRIDGWLIAHPFPKQPEWRIHPALVVTFSVVDMPLSFALDTVLLPIDLTYDPKADKTRYPGAEEQ